MAAQFKFGSIVAEQQRSSAPGYAERPENPSRKYHENELSVGGSHSSVVQGNSPLAVMR